MPCLLASTGALRSFLRAILNEGDVMEKAFSQSEVVELGIQIEKNGRDFYNELVARSESAEAKEIYKFLAGEEEKHIDEELCCDAS